MIKPTAQQLKAGILLCCFSLNMMVSIACSLELNITGHIIAVFTGKHGCHSHHGNNDHQKECSDKRIQKEPAVCPGGSGLSSDSKTEDCCSSSVIKFDQLDKSVNHELSYDIKLYPVDILQFPGWLHIKFDRSLNTSSVYNPRYFHPPAPNIRVLIQRFQI